MRDVVVIGGGISGLSIGRELHLRGLDVLVLERGRRAGGKARSLRPGGGFLMELGPTALNAGLPGLAARLAGLGLGELLPLGPGVRKRYLADRGRLRAISLHPAGFLLSGYLPLAARARLLAEVAVPRRPAGGDAESLHAFASRRFGRAFAERVLAPLAAGIFMADARALCARSAFPGLTGMETRHGSVLRALLMARHGSDAPRRRLGSWREGLGVLPARLAGLLGGRLRTGIAVASIRRLSDGFAITTAQGEIRARAAVLAVPPGPAARLLEPLDPDAASAAAAIPAPPVAVAFFGYRRAQVGHRLDGLGYLATEGSAILSGVQFPSTMFEARAPEGHVAIAAYLGGARRADLAAMPAAALLAMIEAELTETLEISGAPVLARLHRWSAGLPHYTLGHDRRRAVLESLPGRVPGLYPTGNYLNGVSVSACLERGEALARRVAADLAALRSPCPRDPPEPMPWRLAGS